MFNCLLPLLAAANLWAADFQVPALTGPVVDGAAMLSAPAREQLTQLLRKVNDASGTQLQVLTVPDLGGLSIEEASIKVTDKWKLGSAKEDNGVLLMIAARERRVRIEVGQGREGVLPDIIASRIIREVIVPRFREGDVDRAILAGVYAILHYTDPDLVKNVAVPRQQKPGRGGVGVLFVLFMIFMILQVLFGSRRRRLWGMGGVAGGLGGSSWGGGGFGGGGGGWGGGGGGFSGGGASGGW
jgi:uncharacterized protein